MDTTENKKTNSYAEWKYIIHILPFKPLSSFVYKKNLMTSATVFVTCYYIGTTKGWRAGKTKNKPEINKDCSPCNLKNWSSVFKRLMK